MVRKSPNVGQLEVLQWIADGSPDGVMTGFTYKTTAVALRNRHLVKVSKRGGWHAELTDDGRYYLEHGAYPDELPKPGPSRKSGEGKPHPVKAPVRKAKSPATRDAAGARCEPTGTDADSPSAAAQTKPAKIDVPVPAHLRNPHPVVAALRDDKNRFAMTQLVRSRALRILQALVSAAEREGYQVREVRSTSNGYGYSRPESKDHLVIETGETSVKVRVFQQNDRFPHEPTARELAEKDRWGPSIPKYDYTPNEFLRIELDHNWNSRRHLWRDGTRGPLEGKLPSILDEVAYRHAKARERRINSELAQVEHEKQRLIAIERAKVLLRESHRGEVLERQASAWRRSDELRTYVSAMEEVAAGITDPYEKLAASEWISWAKSRVEVLDPLGSRLCVPDDPEPTTEALRPFLRW